jgi:hypothetical protein
MSDTHSLRQLTRKDARRTFISTIPFIAMTPASYSTFFRQPARVGVVQDVIIIGTPGV